MSKKRTHYGTTPDGVTIGGTVHGQGPPIVFPSLPTLGETPYLQH
jgi:hypothetical protein